MVAVRSVTLGADLKAATGRVYAAAEPRQISQLKAGLHDGSFYLIGIGWSLLANVDWVPIVVAGRLDELRPFERKWLNELV